jgi:adenylate cyclase
MSEIPGVVVQAQMLNALLTRGFITPIPSAALWVLVFTFAALATATARAYVNWRGPVLLGVVLLAFLLLAIGAFWGGGVHIPWVIPSVFILVSASGLAWIERGRLRRKWGGYVSPAVLEHILRNESALDAARYEATVIFGDIRGFTTFSEQHSPEKVVRLLNRHLTRFTQTIHAQEGTIDKFLGDGILAVFGVPLPLPDAARRAVRASWLMREASLEPVLDDDQSPYVLACGFGITTGPLVAGHVGSHQRHDFSIIGDTVNLASRLQGVTGKPDVIIDAATYALVQAHVTVEPLGEVTLKGKAHPVACFRVLAWRETPAPAPAGAPPT